MGYKSSYELELEAKVEALQIENKLIRDEMYNMSEWFHAEEKVNYTKELFDLVTQWNNLKRLYKIPQVRKITADMKKVYRTRRQDYTRDDIKESINNYLIEIQKRDATSSYWKHRFTFFEFIKQSNWLPKFINLDLTWM